MTVKMKGLMILSKVLSNKVMKSEVAVLKLVMVVSLALLGYEVVRLCSWR